MRLGRGKTSHPKDSFLCEWCKHRRAQTGAQTGSPGRRAGLSGMPAARTCVPGALRAGLNGMPAARACVPGALRAGLNNMPAARACVPGALRAGLNDMPAARACVPGALRAGLNNMPAARACVPGALRAGLNNMPAARACVPGALRAGLNNMPAARACVPGALRAGLNDMPAARACVPGALRAGLNDMPAARACVPGALRARTACSLAWRLPAYHIRSLNTFARMRQRFGTADETAVQHGRRDSGSARQTRQRFGTADETAFGTWHRHLLPPRPFPHPLSRFCTPLTLWEGTYPQRIRCPPPQVAILPGCPDWWPLLAALATPLTAAAFKKLKK
eukprot:364785-Chlamydomonas_euryale.AAC.16